MISVFLCSRDKNWQGKLIAIIVSRYGNDGADALCKICDAGGTTIAQRLDTAKSPEMPESANATGCIDFIMSPEDMDPKTAALIAAGPAAEPRALKHDARKQPWHHRSVRN